MKNKMYELKIFKKNIEQPFFVLVLEEYAYSSQDLNKPRDINMLTFLFNSVFSESYKEILNFEVPFRVINYKNYNFILNHLKENHPEVLI